MNQRTIQGFSLIELLVVISVLTLLVAIIIPVVGRVRESSHQAVCASNLRGLGQATLTYIAANGGRIPFERAESGPGSGYANPPWFNLLAPYAEASVRSNISLEPGTEKIFRCPSQTGDFALSYGPSMGAFVEGNTQLLHTQIVSPSRKVWLLDVYPGHVYFFNPAIPAEVWAAPRHRGKINVLYFDGHVSSATLKEIEEKRPLLFQPTRN